MTRLVGSREVLCVLVLLGCNAVSGNAKQQDAGAGPASEPASDAGVSAAAGSGSRAELGKEFPCLGESSVHTKAGGNTRGPEPLCTNLNAEARCVGITTQEDADRTCSSDADCVWAEFAPSCVDHCYTAAIVSKAGAKVIADAVDELESSVCSRFDDAGCVYFPSGCVAPLPSDPVCDAGQCTELSGCGLGPHRAAPLIAKQLPALAEGCTTDEECRVERPTACDWSCPDAPALIAKVHTVDYNHLLASIRTACDGTQAGTGGCPIPPCDPPPDVEAICQDGTCVAR